MIDELLQRYFADEATPDEAARVLHWFDTDAGQAYLATRLNGQLDKPNWQNVSAAKSPSADRVWQRLTQARMADSGRPETLVRRLGWGVPMWQRAAIVAGVLLLAAGGYRAYEQWNPAEQTQQTAFGKTRTLTLPDGSVVTLNGNSRLRYATHWVAGQTRNVWLDGEGFFRVTHRQNHERFVVHLPNKLSIEVLGTQFDVLARESRAKVVLNNGRIRLDMGNAARPNVIMQPGDLVYADVKDKVYYRKRVNPVVESSWQTGRLHIDDMTLSEVARLLEETYGVEIVITNPQVGRQKLSGTLPNQSINTILNGLSTLFELHISRDGNQITIQ